METLYEKIRLLLEAHKIDAAVKLIQEGLEQEPNDDELYTLWAHCKIQQSDMQGAEKLCKKALAINAENYMAKVCLVCVYNEFRAFDKSKPILKDLLQSDPLDVNAHYLLANVYCGEEDYENAMKSIDKALNLNPNNSDYFVLKSAIYRAMGQTQRADFYANRALETDPDEADALVEKGWVAMEQNNVSEAKEFFGQALAMNPVSENAKEGMKYALKNENVFFNKYYRFVVAVSRLKHSQRIMACVAIIAFVLFLHKLTKASIGWLVIYAYVIFVALTSTADALSNFFMARSPYARNVLQKEDLTEGYVAIAIWAYFFVYVILAFILDKSLFLSVSILMLIFPLKRLAARRGKPSFGKFAILSAVMVIAVLYLTIGTLIGIEVKPMVFSFYVLVAVACSWLPHFVKEDN